MQQRVIVGHQESRARHETPPVVAVILAATAVGLATAIVDRPTALGAVLARGSTTVALAVLGASSAARCSGPGV